MNIDLDMAVTEIVQSDYRTAEVFKKFHLNYCCSGTLPLRSACTSKNVNYETVVKELAASTRNFSISGQLPFSEWKIEFLIDFISNIHHTYIYKTTPELKASLDNFSLGHSTKYPQLPQITAAFHKLAGVLMIHNKHEDEVIFPYIRQIDSAYRRREAYGNLFVRTLRKPLDIIDREHIQTAELLDTLRSVTLNFNPGKKDCITYQVLCQRLKEFHDNLLQHQFLEHEFLFPKAIAIEQYLLQL